MRVIAKRTLIEQYKVFPDCQEALERWDKLMSKNNYHPLDKNKLKFRVITTRTPTRIITTIDLFGGEKMLKRISAKVVDLQQDHLDEVLNSLGYFKKDDEIVEH